jgi:hypothetical protein
MRPQLLSSPTVAHQLRRHRRGICFLDQQEGSAVQSGHDQAVRPDFKDLVGARWVDLVRGNPEGVWQDFLLQLDHARRNPWTWRWASSGTT